MALYQRGVIVCGFSATSSRSSSGCVYKTMKWECMAPVFCRQSANSKWVKFKQSSLFVCVCMSILLPRFIVTLLRYVSIELKKLLTYILTYLLSLKTNLLMLFLTTWWSTVNVEQLVFNFYRATLRQCVMACVRSSVRHKPVLYSETELVCRGFPRLILHCIGRDFG